MNHNIQPNKLHLGCFASPLDGWLNTDITSHIYISKIPFLAELLFRLGKMDQTRIDQHRDKVFNKVHYLNLAKPFPYSDGSFECVFSAHVFEHIPRKQMAGLLREILRVLSPGGVMRVSVPDLDFFIRHYQPECADDFVNAVFEISQANDKNRHHWMYSAYTLIKLLKDAGFANVRQWGFREGTCSDIDQLDNRPEHSIFVEGSKPQ